MVKQKSGCRFMILVGILVSLGGPSAAAAHDACFDYCHGLAMEWWETGLYTQEEIDEMMFQCIDICRILPE